MQRQLPGFAPIPFERIGLYTDEFRPRLPVANPVINPGSRAFVEALEVRLQPGRGAQDVRICYTLDGSEPTANSELYREPFRIRAGGTLRAVAFSTDGKQRSGVSAAAYTAYRLGPDAGVSLAGLPAVEPHAHGGLKENRNYAGNGPVSLAGRLYATSLMLCPETAPGGGRGEVTYDLVGGLEKAVTLKATIGVDDAVKPNGSVVFSVEVERGGTWERVFESSVLRGGQGAGHRASIAGAQRSAVGHHRRRRQHPLRPCGLG